MNTNNALRESSAELAYIVNDGNAVEALSNTAENERITEHTMVY